MPIAIARTLHLSMSRHRVPRSPSPSLAAFISSDSDLDDGDLSEDSTSRRKEIRASRRPTVHEGTIAHSPYDGRIPLIPNDSDSDDSSLLACSRPSSAIQSSAVFSTGLAGVSQIGATDSTSESLSLMASSSSVGLPAGGGLPYGLASPLLDLPQSEPISTATRSIESSASSYPVNASNSSFPLSTMGSTVMFDTDFPPRNRKKSDRDI